jgi:membrane protein DedA with SNARE-associated domain
VPLLLASLIAIPSNVGYVAVFGLIAIETMGIPVPGETALIAGALAAHDGQLEIAVLVALAAAAAILGDNVGFLLGRRFGRRVFARPGPGYDQRLALLDLGEPFFVRHGPKAVFLGRWVSGLRIASAWLAGMNKMRWPSFLLWNALGGIVWAVGVGLGAFFAGHAFETVITRIGVVGALAIVVPIVLFVAWRHRTHNAALKARGRAIRLAREQEDAALGGDVAPGTAAAS